MFGCVYMVIGPPQGQSARESLLEDTLLDSKLCESNLLKVDYQQVAQLQGRLQSVWWWPWLCCSLLDRPQVPVSLDQSLCRGAMRFIC